MTRFLLVLKVKELNTLTFLKTENANKLVHKRTKENVEKTYTHEIILI